MMKSTLNQLTIVDWISILRLVLIPFLLVLILKEKKNAVSWVMLAGFFAEVLDGFLARHFKRGPETGARLDTMADLLFLICGLFGLFWVYKDFVMDRLALPLTAIALFVVQYLLSLLRYGKASNFHTYLARITSVTMAGMLVTFFLHEPVTWLFTLAFVLSIAEAFEEIILVCLLPNWKTDVKGIYWTTRQRD